jgi:cytochrome c oxidase subunit 2
MIRRGGAAALLGLAAAGCDTVQTSLGGQGADSADFMGLFKLFLAVTGFFYLLVIGGLIAALVRRRSGKAHVAERGEHHVQIPAIRLALIVWSALIVVTLLGLSLASFFTDRSMAASAAHPGVEIMVTGNQWWWDVEYVSPTASQRFRTANELHLPVGVPARIQLKSNDVIHSLWIPNLAGKQDLIPGRDTDLNLLPRKIGLYRAQCAEFCGAQHAHMALDVTVESKADFERWWAAQLRPAAAPRTPEQLAGLRYFSSRECAACHAIAGTSASASFGPDLTHFASRRSIAAGTMPMNSGNLYGWVADPQSQKPGTRMPTVGLEPAELHAVVAYLETLK